MLTRWCIRILVIVVADDDIKDIDDNKDDKDDKDNKEND